ncbi:CBS domain containing-hemolysin-like protein [Kurthia huakuii]|nr:CBS domain containing-hemolysin-like protein [Kurthia huakuii]
MHAEIPLDHDIVGGLMLEKMQRVPRPGDVFEAYGLTFTVNNIEGTHVTKVTIVKGS